MRNFIPVLYLFILSLFACSEVENASIQKCWVLSERGDGFQLYYPCGDERIQASRFSPAYNFYDSNKCEYLVLSPNDAHYFIEGSYEYDPEFLSITVESLKKNLIVKFRILELKENQLKVQLLEGSHNSF